MFITLKLKKVVEKFVKKLFYGEKLIYWMDICCRCILALPLYVPTTYVTEIKETYLKFTFIKNHAH